MSFRANRRDISPIKNNQFDLVQHLCRNLVKEKLCFSLIFLYKYPLITDFSHMDEYLLLKQRINIEHSEYKKYKRYQLRYDRQLNTFSSFVYMASLKILIKKIGIYIIILIFFVKIYILFLQCVYCDNKI